MSTSFVERIVGICARYAGVVALVAVILGIICGEYSSTHFAMNSNAEAIISPKTTWRKLQAVYDRDFPQQNNLTVVVIDGATPELADAAATSLTAALQRRPDVFHSVRRPDGGPFFAHEGLLFLPVDQVKATTDEMIAAQPFLGGLAVDPSLRGIMDSLSTALQGVAHGQTSLEQLHGPITQFSQTLDGVLQGRPAYLAWRSMVTGQPPSTLELRQFIQIQSKLDFTALTPGGRASDVIRSTAVRLGLVPSHGVRVRLTGPVPMADDEFVTLADRAVLMVTLMMSAVLAMLWLAVHSFRLIFAILVSVFVGLAITAAAGLAIFGAFNVISVAFIALFVGLGVDFGIQFCVRYRAERHEHDNLDVALRRAGDGVGNALTLAAAATAAGFFSFLPTSYIGVAQLGLIAGMGMIVTYVLSIMLLPALVKLLAPPGEPDRIGYQALAPLDDFLVRRRGMVTLATGILVLIAIALLPQLKFDFNPLNLRSPKVESVGTALELMKDPLTTPNTINVLAPSHAQIQRRAMVLSALPAVSHVVTVDSFIPDDQPQKLALINDASTLLDPTLNPILVKPPPSDADNIQALLAAARALDDGARHAAPAAANPARHLALDLRHIAAGRRDVRTRVDEALLPGLNTMLNQLRDVLEPQPVALNTLPRDLVRDWVTPNGTWRADVFPKGNANDNSTLREFVREVRVVVPEATGTPISIQESGTTIVRAFIQAGVLSFLSITILLVVALRRAKDVLIALGPLVLAGILTLGTCVAIGMQLNYANIIALPLLFGIGVAFDIYFVMAWRSGARRLLQSPLTRAVVLSAGTTGSAFGTLWLSNHPGIASMGELLAISLAWILACVLFLLPALLAQATYREGLPETV
ncbi:MAG: MMPL family transporter [Rhizomicrobium sp.]|jgi:hopanoid biosynthesis associated RND transporter like protein HpnN